MIFGYLTDSIENALDVADGVLDGEGPTKRQVARLIDDGLTIAAIAATIERYEYENGRLKYYLGDQADRFIGTVQRRMIARSQQPKMVNRMLCET